ncbi:13093_t:CDS:2, partial [Funneliformis caledonium]
LPLHKELSEFIIPKNFYNELEKTLQKNINVGYMHLQTNTLDETLNAAIAHTNTKEKKVLTIKFDCSWSHSCNAKQASGEFIYLDDLEGYRYKPIIAFHVIEKSHVITKKGKNENFDEKVQIIPVLEVSDLLLEVCIDEDLDFNKTLANILIVSEIYADIKHASKNIRKNLYMYIQHIMRYFNEYVFTAGLKKKNNEPDTLVNEKLRYIQVESHNEVFNLKILRFVDKRIDFWASYKAQHVLDIIDKNESLNHIIEVVHKYNQERATNYSNERKELQEFDFSQELIPYKYKVEERIRANTFYPSFVKLIIDFDAIIKLAGMFIK